MQSAVSSLLLTILTAKVSFATWQDVACSQSETVCPFSKPPLLLISLDGFRAEYLLDHVTPNIQRLYDCGTHAPYMYASFPSKTFPNHYSIVTGLYPESHGIVDNTMYDPSFNAVFAVSNSSQFESRWYGGEPIWNTVQKHNMISATCTWPGSEVDINGMRPNYYEHYNTSVPFSDRVETVIGWLKLPEEQRPQFITLYHFQPDATAHVYGPDSQQVIAQLAVVDGMIDLLMSRLYEEGFFQCMNVIILADHGFATTPCKDFILLNNTIQTGGLYIFTGPVGRLHWTNLSAYEHPQQIEQLLRCQSSLYTVYSRSETPKRFHYSRNPRCGDVIMSAQVPWQIANASYLSSVRNVLELLGIPEDSGAPNNGTVGALYGALAENVAPPSVTVQLFDQCSFQQSRFELCGAWSCPSFAHSSINLCPGQQTPLLPKLKLGMDAFDPCTLTTCSFASTYSQALSIPLGVSFLFQGSSGSYDFVSHLSTEQCVVRDRRLSVACSTFMGARDAQEMHMRPLYMPNSHDYNVHMSSSYVPMFDGFFSGVWASFHKLLTQYAARFGVLQIVVGPIFDNDFDGLADSTNQIMSGLTFNFIPVPTHYFAVISRCDGEWLADASCFGNITAISFALPHREQPVNSCQNMTAYFYEHTARVKDVELLSGVAFFTNIDAGKSIMLRTEIHQDLWLGDT